MESLMKPTIRLILPAMLLLGLAGCQQEGPAERAGRSLDKAGQSVRDTVDPPRGPVERLGRSCGELRRAVESGGAGLSCA
jgi:hypothetical protein